MNINHKGVHLVPAVKMPNDPKNLVLNEEEEKEWTNEEQQILEEKIRNEGNNIGTVLRLVGLLNDRTIQQITTRVKWTLLPPEEKIPYEIFRNSQMKTDTQLVTSNSTNMIEIKKKKPRQRHSSVEELQPQKISTIRRNSFSREGKNGISLSMNKGFTIHSNPRAYESESYNSLQGSGLASPRFSPLMSNGNMSYDSSSCSVENYTIDLNVINSIITENEQYLQVIQNAFMKNIPIQPTVFTSFQNNLNKLMQYSHQLSYPTNLPICSFNLIIPPQLKEIGMVDVVHSPPQLNWNFPI